MLRYCIFTPESLYMLGTGAVEELHKALWKATIDTTGLIDDEFIETLKKMTPNDRSLWVGFTPEFKSAMIAGFTLEKGKHYHITDDWAPTASKKEVVRYFLKQVDAGIDVNLAKELTKANYNIL